MVTLHTGEDGEHFRGDHDGEVFNTLVAEDFLYVRLEAGHLQ